MGPDHGKARRFMQEKILHFLAQRQPPATEISHRRIIDLVKRLEEGLFRTAATQDEYLNLETLESRLYGIIHRPQMSNNNPESSQMSIRRPQMSNNNPESSQDSNSSNMISSTDNSTVTASTGNNVSAATSTSTS